MGTITIVGLGPGAVGHLSLETMGLLQSCARRCIPPLPSWKSKT